MSPEEFPLSRRDMEDIDREKGRFFLLCKLGLHRWGKWKVKEMGCVNDAVTGRKVAAFVTMQRTCMACGHRESELF